MAPETWRYVRSYLVISGWPDKGLLIAEAIAVWAFGASWLMKGLELDVLLGGRKGAVGEIG